MDQAEHGESKQGSHPREKRPSFARRTAEVGCPHMSILQTEILGSFGKRVFEIVGMFPVDDIDGHLANETSQLAGTRIWHHSHR